MQKSFDQLLPIEREFLLKERAYHLERLQDVEKRLNMPSSLHNREMRRVFQRVGKEQDGESNRR